MTVLAVVSFMNRSTSIVGWVFLVLYKMIKDKSYLAYLQSLIIAGLPTLAILIAIDSVFYGELTFTAYTFLLKNLIEGVSEMFGVSPFAFYLKDTLPYVMNFYFPFFLMGVCYNFYQNFT